MGHALGNNYGKFYSFQSKPVFLDLQFVVNKADSGGFGVTNIKGQGVQSVFMQTSSTAAKGNPFVNNTSAGYALIQLEYNYARAYCLNHCITSPVTGSNLAINGSALTAGVPYQITAVGAGANGSATIAAVADSSGSLASTWFSLYDGYGNTWIIWFSVSGVGARPNLGQAAADGAIGLHYVQQSIVTGDSAATIGGDLATTVAALPSGISGVFSFTTAGTTTMTATSTLASPLPGAPSEGTAATGFTFALVNKTSNATDWLKVGVPPGVQPAIGVSFVAIATGYSTGGGSSGTVKAIGQSGVQFLELIGDPNLSIGPGPSGPSANVGGWLLVQFLASSFAGSALANHTHTLNLKNAAVADGATTRVNAGTNLLGANTGSDIAIAGNGANGGIANASAGTPAGTLSYVPTAPTDASLVKMSILLEQAARVGGNNE